MTVVLVALAGALGAPTRLVVERVATRATRGSFPWGTGIANVTGSFALGLVAGLALRHGLSPSAVAVAGSGFLGAYTTFSTYALETVRLATAGGARGRRAAVGYLGASVLLGVAAAVGGLAATGAF